MRLFFIFMFFKIIRIPLVVDSPLLKFYQNKSLACFMKIAGKITGTRKMIRIA